MRLLLQFSACLALGLVVAVIILVGLMFCGWFGLIDGLMLTGKPLAHLSLVLLPEWFWHALTGVPNAAAHQDLRSFLSLCAALGQVGVVFALGFMRLWYQP